MLTVIKYNFSYSALESSPWVPLWLLTFFPDNTFNTPVTNYDTRDYGVSETNKQTNKHKLPPLLRHKGPAKVLN